MDNKNEKLLRIVQVAPDVYPVPPLNYGGIERVIYDLVEELVRRGHKVFLFAPKGSKTSAELLPYRHSTAWQQSEIIKDVIADLPNNIDIIHDHTHSSIIGRIQLPLSIPVVCTEHFSGNCPVKHPIYASKTVLERYGNSNGDYIHHGINLKEFEFSDKKENYLLFIGKIDKSKGPQFAIEVAEKLGKLLLLAGPIHDDKYFNTYLHPKLITNPNIQYIGEVGGKKKQDLIKNAEVVLFPTLCEESFGLVAIEAMACGTPVLGFPSGAVPEVLEDFPDLICKDSKDMLKKLTNKKFPSSNILRECVRRKFTIEKMADRYIEIYNRVIS